MFTPLSVVAGLSFNSTESSVVDGKGDSSAKTPDNISASIYSDSCINIGLSF